MTSIRMEWAFTRKSQEILEGSKKQQEYHQSRLEFWEDMKEKVHQKIKEDGIQITDSILQRKSLALAGGGFENMNINQRYSSSNAPARGASVDIKQEYVEDMNECETKISYHRKKVSEYTSWVSFFSGPTPLEVNLNYEDHQFFFKPCSLEDKDNA